MTKPVFSEGIPLKKQFGQHFLRSQAVADAIVQAVTLNNSSSVFEIGCGDGFLTKTILKAAQERLWIFEIDHQWATFIKNSISDKRITMFEQNFLDVDPQLLEPYKPWTLLSNLPYQITFPILHWLARNRYLLREGVIMVQEEVAEKIVKTGGKGYGFSSLFFQHIFTWKKLNKVMPGDFYPPPKVYSRLLYFKPKENPVLIPDEEKFWEFIKLCFSSTEAHAKK